LLTAEYLAAWWPYRAFDERAPVQETRSSAVSEISANRGCNLGLPVELAADRIR
jgi:hypothetical protein